MKSTRQLSPRLVNVVGAAVCLVLCGATGFMVVGSARKTGVEELRNEERVRLESIIADYALRKKTLAETLQEQSPEAGNATSRSLETASTSNARLARLHAAAEKDGIVIDEFNRNPVVSDPAPAHVPIAVNGRSSFQNLVSFLATLQAEFPDMAVRTFRLGTKANEPGGGMTFSLDVRWYVAQTD